MPLLYVPNSKTKGKWFLCIHIEMFQGGKLDFNQNKTWKTNIL